VHINLNYIFDKIDKFNYLSHIKDDMLIWLVHCIVHSFNVFY